MSLQILGGSTNTVYDTNANEILKFVPTSSAVNHLQDTNAATGNPPELAAIGDDTNIGLKLSPKGTGEVLLNAGGVLQGGSAGGQSTLDKLINRKTPVSDNTATDLYTVTIPNGDHAAGIRVLAIATLIGADNRESTRVVEYQVVLTRITGTAAVVAISSAIGGQIATLGGGATLTLVLGVSAVSGAAGATNTFTIQVTTVGSVAQNSRVTAVAELLNMEATGVTIATA